MSEMSLQMAGEQKPMVTREQYEQARAVLDVLPPGVYTKCARCGQWKMGGEIHFVLDSVLCEECA